MMDANTALRALCATECRFHVYRRDRWTVDLDPGNRSLMGYGDTFLEAAETGLLKWAHAESNKYPWVKDYVLSDIGTWHVTAKDNRTLHDPDFHRVCQLLKPDPHAEVRESWRRAVSAAGSAPVFLTVLSDVYHFMAKNNIRFVHKKED